jgi:hypothetical protein
MLTEKFPMLSVRADYLLSSLPVVAGELTPDRLGWRMAG